MIFKKCRVSSEGSPVSPKFVSLFTSFSRELSRHKSHFMTPVSSGGGENNLANVRVTISNCLIIFSFPEVLVTFGDSELNKLYESEHRELSWCNKIPLCLSYSSNLSSSVSGLKCVSEETPPKYDCRM